MKEILKLTGSLTLICAIAGAALACFSAVTAAPKAAAASAQRTAKMRLVLPRETATTEECLTAGNGVVFFAAKDGAGKITAWCAQSSDPNGFGGQLTILAGLQPQDGTIRAVVVAENSETPGIGSNVCERAVKRSLWQFFSGKHSGGTGQLPPNRYLDGFSGQPLPGDGSFSFADKAAPGKIVPVSGATVTSQAILNAVNRIGEAWRTHRSTLNQLMEKKPQ